MAKNKKRKTFAVSQRYAYHNKRSKDKSVTENKRIYSKQWIEGYNDPYAKTNYNAVCYEIRQSKGKISRDYSILLNGYKNGLKARLKDSKDKASCERVLNFGSSEFGDYSVDAYGNIKGKK